MMQKKGISRIKEYFEFLNKKALFPNRLEKEIQKWNSKQLFDFVDESVELIPQTHERSSSVFDFVANSQLSGEPIPCAWLDCRISHADTLARFAALYSDRVLIREPFEKYLGEHRADAFVKFDIVNDLKILYHLKPLLEAGLIGFASSKLHFCATCYEKYIQGKDRALQRKISVARKLLNEKFLRETKVSLKIEDGIPLIEILGPEDFGGHSYLLMDPAKMSKTIKRSSNLTQPGRLMGKDLQKLGIPQRHVSAILGDIVCQNWYSDLYGAHYVTDRGIDFDLISVVNDYETNLYSKALMGALSHSVPFIQDTDISNLVRLRREEGETFRVYRDAVASTLKSVDSVDIKTMKESFNDSVRPELDKIDLAIRNSRKLLWGSLKRDFLFGTGFISIGLFSGLLPANIGVIVAALGGLKSASTILEKTSKLISEPPEIRDNKYYFLWKVKKKSSGKH